MESKALEIVPESKMINFEECAMSAETVLAQVALIQNVMEKTMKDGTHYGVIPGCGDKPALLKPGAEKISTTFRLAPKYEIKRTDLSGGHREYEIVCSLYHIPTNQLVGQGVGSCSTMEGKYRFRQAQQKCPECGKETIIKGKKQYGGGWLCWGKKGGCGAKFNDGDPSIENQDMGRVEHDNPADYGNTVLKMAKKRAHVDAVLTATACSDIFTQDIEDMPPEILNVTGTTKPQQEQGEPYPDQEKKTQTGPKPMTGKQRGKFYAMCKNPEVGFSDKDVDEFANYLKDSEEVETTEIEGKTKVTTKGASHIFKNFDSLKSDFIESRMQ